jgi:hypothetical protein
MITQEKLPVLLFLSASVTNLLVEIIGPFLDMKTTYSCRTLYNELCYTSPF